MIKVSVELVPSEVCEGESSSFLFQLLVVSSFYIPQLPCLHLHMAFSLCLWLLHISPFYKETSRTCSERTLMTPFFMSTSVSNQGYLLKYWGLRLLHLNGGRTQLSSHYLPRLTDLWELLPGGLCGRRLPGDAWDSQSRGWSLMSDIYRKTELFWCPRHYWPSQP